MKHSSICGKAILPWLEYPSVVVSQTTSLLFEKTRLVTAQEIPAQDDGNRLIKVQSYKKNWLTGWFSVGLDPPKVTTKQFHLVCALCLHLVLEDGIKPLFS